jgi:hypothetical protein
MDRSAADLAVLDIALLNDRTVNENLDGLPAVRTLDVDGFL